MSTFDRDHTVPPRKLEDEDYRRINLPKRLRSSRVRDLPEEDRPFFERYITRLDQMAERGAGVFLYSPDDFTRSQAGAVLAKASRSFRYTSFFTGVWELRENLRSGIQFDEEKSMMDRCREVDFLVLNNLTLADMSQKFLNAKDLTSLVRYRNARCLATIVVSGITAENWVKGDAQLLVAIKEAAVTYQMKGKSEPPGMDEIESYLKEGTSG
jgi:hypothetical protein